MKYLYQCENCFEKWVSDHEELICPLCGSTLIFLEEKNMDKEIEDEEDLIDEFLILLDEEDQDEN